jgi:hypothetical protein
MQLLKFLNFYETTKNGMVEPTYEHFQKWKQIGKPAPAHTGENKLIKQWCESSDWKLGITYMFIMARAMPQQNSLLGVAFTTTIANRRRAL